MRLAIATAILMLAPLTFAGEAAGTIKTSKGTAHIVRNGQQLAATPGETLEVSDSIETGSDGTVGITLLDDTRLTAGPDSTLELRRFVFDTTSHAGSLDASVKRGSLSVISGKIAKANPEQVSFSTSSVTLGVRGTRFIIQAGN
jgi:hypothetical protein